MKLLILQGLPASGKSTFAKEYVKDKKDWVRVNRDDLRNMAGNYILWDREDLITDWELYAIRMALGRRYNVILDSTNLNEGHLEWLLNNVKKDYSVEIEYKFFNTSLEECIERDAKRENPVGKKVIRRMWEKYLKPASPEYDPNLPDCIIVDIDGTVAEKGKRSPYDESKVLEDKPRIVIDILRLFNREGLPETKIIFMSGRHETCREDTEEWLRLNFGYHDGLFMRGANDNRDDRIIKRELYEKHIKGKYNVYLVFDDRNRVVNMWRNELGLEVFQVADGDF